MNTSADASDCRRATNQGDVSERDKKRSDQEEKNHWFWIHINASLLLTAARRRTTSKSVLLTEAQKQLMVHKLPQVLRLHLKRFRYHSSAPVWLSPDSIHLVVYIYLRLLSAPQVVRAEPSGEDRRSRAFRPAPKHGVLLLPGVLAQGPVLLQPQQPRLCRPAASQALPLRPFRCGDASWERLRVRPLHLVLLQHGRR